MINTDLLKLIKILSLERSEIGDIIGLNLDHVIYFDMDCEDDGTDLPEVALLRLCELLLMHAEAKDENEEELILELSWLVTIVLMPFDNGVCNFSLRSELDYFWEIAKRYSNEILNSHDEVYISDFSFQSILTKYGYEVKKLEK